MIRWSRVLKYGLGLFILFWVVLSQVSVIAFLYSQLDLYVGFLPAFTRQFAVGLIIATTVGTIAIGYVWFGSVQAFLVHISKWLIDTEADDALLVEGRIVQDDFVWRLQYTEDDRITVSHRECPKCGTEVVERHLPSSTVLGPNSTFNPPEASQSATTDVWKDVTGKHKVDDSGETLALTCPDCNVAEPGEKELLEGGDAATSRFRKHIERMKRPNSKRNPFESYREKAQSAGNQQPMPTDIWDAYVAETDADDVRPARSQFTLERSEQGRSPVEA